MCSLSFCGFFAIELGTSWRRHLPLFCHFTAVIHPALTGLFITVEDLCFTLGHPQSRGVVPPLSDGRFQVYFDISVIGISGASPVISWTGGNTHLLIVYCESSLS